MRAVILAGDGTVAVADRPVPQPGPGEVRVRVHGAGLNRADLLQRAGLYPAPPGSPADIPGLEFSGVVDAVGDGVSDPAVGRRVAGVAGGGGQAEFLCVPASHCAPVPDGLDLVAFGGVPEAFVTAHDALRTRARLGAGEWVSIHAVGSGVGTAGLQLATALGARVVGTARTQAKLDRCGPLGLAAGLVPPTTGDGTLDILALAQALREATGGGGVDVCLQLVGGRYVEADLLAAAERGRIVLVGTLAGGRADLSILTAMSRRLEIHGTVLRPRDTAEKAAATAAFVAEVVPLLADGRVAPVLEAVVPLADAPSAYDLLAADTTFGKLVLDCR